MVMQVSLLAIQNAAEYRDLGVATSSAQFFRSLGGSAGVAGLGALLASVVGSRTAAGLAVVGAIVGEFFAGYGSDHYGLGYLILQTSAQLRTDMLFATILASALLGVIMFVVVTWIGFKLLARWTYALEQS